MRVFVKEIDPKYVSEDRAAALLGIPRQELSRISHESGFGHAELSNGHEELFFTYEELRKICQLSVQKIH